MNPRQPKNLLNRLVVAKPDASKSLQEFLAAKFGLSRRAAKSVIDARSVWVNRRCVWIAHHALKTGDLVEVPCRAVASAKAGSRAASSAKAGVLQRAAPSARDSGGVLQGARRRALSPSPHACRAVASAKAGRHVRVLVATPSYIVADKPAGMLSSEDPRSVEAVLREQLSLPQLRAVHRLDRDTSGCLLFAKTEEACLAMVEVFKTHKVSKTYYAIVAGRFPHAHEKIDAPLDDQPAVSFVTREAAREDASFLRVRIETGRTNQIRRHLAGIRFPIVGDRTFGLKSARDPRLMAVPRQMLHAATLSMPDPTIKGAEIKAHSPLPADFRATLRLFGMGKR